MPRLSLETRKRITILRKQGFSVSEIITRLTQENVFVSRQAIYNLLKKYRESNQISNQIIDLPKRTRRRKVTHEMISVIDEALTDNDELTARELRLILVERWPDLQVTISTIKRIRNQLGWKFTRPHYCQLLRDVRSYVSQK